MEEDRLVPAQILVLNGASSAGKSSLGRALQRRLGPGWFMLGVDDLLAAILPFGDDPELFEVTGGGVVRTTEALRRAEAAWYAGVAAIAEQAPGLILDEVLLDGAASQARLTTALAGTALTWIGVFCDPDVGERRERLRGDRVAGMHAEQRRRVHDGVQYDHVVDTSRRTAEEVAQELHAALCARGLLSRRADCT
jgi:chloramphenicol 3-O phosphotransferase